MVAIYARETPWSRLGRLPMPRAVGSTTTYQGAFALLTHHDGFPIGRDSPAHDEDVVVSSRCVPSSDLDRHRTLARLEARVDWARHLSTTTTDTTGRQTGER